MRNIVLILAIVLFSSCCAKSKSEQCCAESKKELSLQLYSFREDISKDYDATIQKTAEMGFTSVEAAGYGNGKFYGKTPTEFRQDVERTGMTLLSSHTTRALSEKELKSKDMSESLAWWDECIEAHKIAGAKYIVAPSMPVPKTLADLQTWCDYYNAIGKRCKEKGLSFGYHNHAFEFTKIEEVMMYDFLVEHTLPEFVFFQMDVYWTVMGRQSPVDYFHKYPGRFELLHIKDNKELGQSGMVGFDAIFKNTDVAGTKYLIIEVEKYNYTPAESIKMSIDYLLQCPLVKDSYSRD